MTTHPNETARKVNDTRRANSPMAWAMGGVFLAALLGALFFYDGRDGTTKPGPNTPNVVNNPAGSK
jgi:hypothetical protein